MFRGRQIKRSLTLLVAILVLPAQIGLVRSQQEPPRKESEASADPWAPLKLLEGVWEGDIDGKLGQGRAVRRYRFIMDGRYLLCRHRSVRLPQASSPDGDQHEEIGVFSYDRERKTIVYREFLNEGVVVRSSCKVDGMKVVCTSESVESGPGIRARLTLQVTDRYRFTEKYELAFPGKELELYFTNRWTRSPLPIDWD